MSNKKQSSKKRDVCKNANSRNVRVSECGWKSITGEINLVGTWESEWEGYVILMPKENLGHIAIEWQVER